MDVHQIDRLAAELHAALLERKAVAPLTTRGLDISLEDAYEVQGRMVARLVEQKGRVVGRKVGLTSKAVQAMLNVAQPDFGVLLSGMAYNDGDAIAMSTLIQPRAEGEIAFLLARDLVGPGVTAMNVLAATEAVMPCFEIVDSRIRDWKIAIQDTIADNASCGAFVLGDRMADPREVDLKLCGMVLEKNGEIAAIGAGAAALGSPLNAVAWLANRLGQMGVPLKAGEIILSGSLAALVPVAAGDHLRLAINGLGGCSVSFAA